MAQDRDDQQEERLPEVPPPPELPEVPRIKPNLPPRPKETSEATEYQNMGLAWSIPASLAAPIIVLLLGGAWLDSKLHTSPYFTLGGALLGAITGFINMIRIANRLNK